MEKSQLKKIIKEEIHLIMKEAIAKQDYSRSNKSPMKKQFISFAKKTTNKKDLQGISKDNLYILVDRFTKEDFRGKEYADELQDDNGGGNLTGFIHNVMSDIQGRSEEADGEDNVKKQVTIPSTLKTLISQLNPDIEMPILSMALGKISQKKEKSLSVKEKAILSDVLIALMMNEDPNLGLKFLNIFKQIK